MEWRLSLGPGRSARRDAAIALLVFVILVAPVAYLADRLIKQHSRRTADQFAHQADYVISSIVGRLREYKPLLERAGPHLPTLDRQRYPEVVSLGYVKIARRDANRYVIRAMEPPTLARFVQLDGSSKVQLEAADAAFASKHSAMTPKQSGPVVLIFRPIEQPGLLAVLVFRPDILVQSRFAAMTDLDVEIYDSVISPASILADSDPQEQRGTSLQGPSMRYSRMMEISGRRWIVYIAPRARFELMSRAPLILFTIASFLLAMLVWSLLSARRRSFELGTRMLDRFADLIQVLDVNGTILYAAGPLSAELGPVVGKPFLDFFHPDDRTLIKDALQRAAASNQPEKFGAVRVHTADFKWRELDGSLQQMTSPGRTPETLVIAQDVTDVHALERQLERAARVDSLGRVAAKVAHEFNNVLMALHTNIEVLQRKYRGDPQIQTASETMKRSVLRGTQIAKEILRFSRPTEIHEAPIVIESWLRQLEEELRPLLPPKIEFDLEVAPEKLLLCGDASQLSQVIINLVLNAHDAIRDQGHVLCVATRSPGGRFSFGVVPAGDFAHVRISDNGEGMAPDALRHLFEPLFTTKRHGTGLGLAISQQIVSAHHGFMFAESTPGKGTDVHVFLPTVVSAESCGSKTVSQP